MTRRRIVIISVSIAAAVGVVLALALPAVLGTSAGSQSAQDSGSGIATDPSESGTDAAAGGTGNGGTNDTGTDQDRAEVPNTADGYTLPPSGDSGAIDTTTPLVTAPLPATATEAGGIVAGFPSDVLQASSLSTVMSSSVASEGVRLQATLVAVTPRSVADVLAFYRDGLAALGFTAGAAASDSAAFTRGTDTVTVTTTVTNGETSYTVYGAFTAVAA